MFNKLFSKKTNEPSPEPMLEHDQIWPTLPTRQRFRRTRSAASESLYADYVSDDWGDAPTVFHDREGHEIYPRSPSADDLEDWQRSSSNPGQALFRNMSARVRSLSVSRPNWSRAPPTSGVPTYGWAQRVEQAGGPDLKQRRRDEARSRRPMGIPVPNPAPGPIDVRGDRDEVGTSALQAPALVRRKSSSRSVRAPGPGPSTGTDKPVRTAQGHRSSTSSPTIIVNPKTEGRRHLSRVEKIAAVFQHVASLPFIVDTPVKTYYPPTDADKLADQAGAAPAEPFHMYDVPPSVPKRYRPPPPGLKAGWYQPKPPKPPKKKKKDKAKEPEGRKTKTNLGGVTGDLTLDEFDDELFEYPDFDGPYTGDTPTLQSDLYTDESDLGPVNVMDYPIRPAFFPGPIKSTGLTTRTEPVEPVEAVGVARPGGPLRIMPPPGVMGPEMGETGMIDGVRLLGGGYGPTYGPPPGAGPPYGPGLGYPPGAGYGYGPGDGAEYGYDDYDEDDYTEEGESELSRGPIPPSLSTSGFTVPPLVIPTPTGKTAPVFPLSQQGEGHGTYERHYEVADGDGEEDLSGGRGARDGRGASAQGWGLGGRGASAQGWAARGGSAQGVGLRGASAQGWGQRVASAQGWGQRVTSAQGKRASPGPGRGLSAQGWGPPMREPGQPPSAQGWGPPAREPSAQGWGPPAREPLSAQGWAPPTRDPGQPPSAQGWGPPAREPGQPPSAQGWGPPRREPSAQGLAQEWAPPTREPGAPPHKASAQGWGRSPSHDWGKPPSLGWGSSPESAGQEDFRSTPGRTPRAYEFPIPPGTYGQLPKGYESQWGPSPQAQWEPSPQTGWGPSPQTAYGPSPQFAYAPYPYGYYAQPVWDPYGVAPDSGKHFHITDSPPRRHRGDSPPPIPSPIATSVALSRRSAG